MNSRLILVAGLALAALPLSFASAEPWSPSAGFRVGGYGFRHVADSNLDWQDCRMDGAGVFAQMDRGTPLYLQLSFDAYHATGPTIASGMDRLSMTTIGSAGVRLENSTPFWPHIEIGVGAEWTSVEIGEASDRRMLPVGVIGTGLEIAIQRVRLGTTLRIMATSLPEHGHAAESATKHDGEASDAPHVHDEDIEFAFEVAGQATFSIRYDF